MSLVAKWLDGLRCHLVYWYGGRPQPRRHCVRWGPSSPPQKRGLSPPLFDHVYYGQIARWIKMPLGMEVGLSPGHIVLDRDPGNLPPKIRSTAPIFGGCLLWLNGWMDQDVTWYAGRPWPRLHCVRWGPSSPSQKMGTVLLIFGRCLLWPNGHPSQYSYCWTLVHVRIRTMMMMVTSLRTTRHTNLAKRSFSCLASAVWNGLALAARLSQLLMPSCAFWKRLSVCHILTYQCCHLAIAGASDSVVITDCSVSCCYHRCDMLSLHHVIFICW